MSIRIEKSGLAATVQDLGRLGHRKMGVPTSGAADVFSAAVANFLVGNQAEAAVLEMHFPAPTVVFERETMAAFCSPEGFAFFKNGEKVAAFRPFWAEKGQIVRFSTTEKGGGRGYLAIADGGFAGEKWLGSRSTLTVAEVGGHAGRAVRSGDVLAFKNDFTKTFLGKKNASGQPLFGLSKSALLPFSTEPTIRILSGAEHSFLINESAQLIENQWFTIQNESDRMGTRLCGDPLFLTKKVELVSSAVAVGTLQLLPDGQLIALGPDCQTTGGYPRIGSVISADLPVFSQLRAGRDRCRFRVVTMLEAEAAFFDFRKKMRQIDRACGLLRSIAPF